jgi:hypothetical protein
LHCYKAQKSVSRSILSRGTPVNGNHPRIGVSLKHRHGNRVLSVIWESEVKKVNMVDELSIQE